MAAPIMCSASTIYRSLVEGNFKPGEWVAVSPDLGVFSMKLYRYSNELSFLEVAVE